MDLTIAILCKDDLSLTNSILKELAYQDKIESVDILLFDSPEYNILSEDDINNFNIEFPMLNLKLIKSFYNRVDITHNIIGNTSKTFILFITNLITFSDSGYLERIMNKVEDKDPIAVSTILLPPLSSLKTRLGYSLYNLMYKSINIRNNIVHSSFFMVRINRLWDIEFPILHSVDKLHIKIKNCGFGDTFLIKEGIENYSDKFLVNSFKRYIESIINILK